MINFKISTKINIIISLSGIFISLGIGSLGIITLFIYLAFIILAWLYRTKNSWIFFIVYLVSILNFLNNFMLSKGVIGSFLVNEIVNYIIISFSLCGIIIFFILNQKEIKKEKNNVK